MQMGHQAANCTVGTVDWKRMYGEGVFHMQQAVFQSDIDRMKRAKQIDFAALEKAAHDYAKVGGGARGRREAAALASARGLRVELLVA